MIDHPSPIGALFLVYALLASSAQPGEAAQKKQQVHATVSEADARLVAISNVPDGTIESAELETQHRRLVWSIDVKTPQSPNITEVSVDAVTGKIVSTIVETPAQEAAEAAADQRAAAEAAAAKKPVVTR